MSQRSTTGDVETELAELHRKYKVMEGDRKSYTEDSQKVLKKQRSTIEKLKRDNETLKDELQLDTSQAGGGIGSHTLSSASAQLAKLQEQADGYTRRVDKEKRKIDDLDKQIKQLNEKIAHQREGMGGVHAARENNLKTQKQIKVLENRLDKSLVKFNESLAYNKQIRESIDNLRRERVVFDGIYKKLEKELEEKKKEMAKIIEVSNIAYEARDRAQQEMQMLKNQADQEQAAFEQEWRDLGKLIEQDKKMKEYLKQRGGADKMDLKQEDEEKLRKKIIKGNWSIAKDKASQQASLQKVQSYEEAFAKIQEATGIHDIDELVTTFIEAEDQNFTLFNYVNELNTEVEKLEEQIAEIRREIEKYRGQGAYTDNQRKKVLQDLEENLRQTEEKAELYEHKAAQAMATVNSLKAGIQSIFNKIGCSQSAVSEMLGNAGVTESNMMQYLGIIEQRTNEILQMYASIQMVQGADTSQTLIHMLGQGPQLPAGSVSISINPPSAGDDGSDDDSEPEEEDRPLSRDELRQRTLRGLQRKETKANQKSTGTKGFSSLTRSRGMKKPGGAFSSTNTPLSAKEDLF